MSRDPWWWGQLRDDWKVRWRKLIFCLCKAVMPEHLPCKCCLIILYSHFWWLFVFFDFIIIWDLSVHCCYLLQLISCRLKENFSFWKCFSHSSNTCVLESTPKSVKQNQRCLVKILLLLCWKSHMQIAFNDLTAISNVKANSTYIYMYHCTQSTGNHFD